MGRDVVSVDKKQRTAQKKIVKDLFWVFSLSTKIDEH